ncbi:MAG TPA: OB-fold domain-containing protein [Mycobacteriales bacterium]|nr:OB-fold domain-containing protein [Mycobacteriales bacterium]
MTAARPLPVPDEQSAPYWQAAAEHTLTMASCSACGALSLPPDSVCASCASTSAGICFTPVSHRGVVRSWTVVRQSFLAGFDDEVPYVLVDVELADQADLRMVARLVNGTAADLRLGAGVRVTFEDVAPGVSIPAFTLDETQ